MFNIHKTFGSFGVKLRCTMYIKMVHLTVFKLAFEIFRTMPVYQSSSGQFEK